MLLRTTALVARASLPPLCLSSTRTRGRFGSAGSCAGGGVGSSSEPKRVCGFYSAGVYLGRPSQHSDWRADKEWKCRLKRRAYSLSTTDNRQQTTALLIIFHKPQFHTYRHPLLQYHNDTICLPADIQRIARTEHCTTLHAEKICTAGPTTYCIIGTTVEQAYCTGILYCTKQQSTVKKKHTTGLYLLKIPVIRYLYRYCTVPVCTVCTVCIVQW